LWHLDNTVFREAEFDLLEERRPRGVSIAAAHAEEERGDFVPVNLI